MKVAFVSQPFEDVVPPVEGGSLAIWIYQVARRLVPHCDIVIYAKKGHDQSEQQWYENIEYRRFSVTFDERMLKPLKLLERVFRHPYPTRPVFSSRWFYPGYITKVAQDLRQQKCDIIHIFNFSQFVPVIRTANPDAKIVLHMQCEWLTQLDRAMIERRLRQVDLALGCSDYITAQIRRRFPQMAEKCRTVYNGVDVDYFVPVNGSDPGPQNKTKRLLFVGRVSPEKGVHVLLEAFHQVVEQYPQVHLDIAGPVAAAPFEYMVLVSGDPLVSNLASFYRGIFRRGEYGSYLQAYLPGVADRINFLGPIPQPRLIELYQQADILINPSLTEAFGMSLVEAMASQVPVVATKVGGMTEIVGARGAGLLVAPGSAPALAQAIISLLRDDERRKIMGTGGRQQAAECYGWPQVAASVLEQYRSITPAPVKALS